MSSVTDFNATLDNINSQRRAVRVSGQVAGVAFDDITMKSMVIGESLLNPSAMTSITFHSAIFKKGTNQPAFKNWESLKGRDINLLLYDQIPNNLSINQKVYRMDNRSFMPVNVARTEEFTIHCCDNTVLEDAQHLMSKSWKCTTPDKIVQEALQCVGAQQSDVQSAGPARDYVAEHIHPFQVISQQCNAAVDGEDPSFVHYMTLSNQNGQKAKHHFKSLRSMINITSNNIRRKFVANNKGALGKADYNEAPPMGGIIPIEYAITYEFPCDFDYLTDLLNGVNEQGQAFNSLITHSPMNMNPQFLNGIAGMTGMMGSSCYKGANMKQSITNKGAGQDYGCSTDVEKHLLLRQARMALLDRDKIALRLVSRWCPDVHVGDIIQLETHTSGSGDYLVVSLTHKIQLGGFSTTTYDCIKTTF